MVCRRYPSRGQCPGLRRSHLSPKSGSASELPFLVSASMAESLLITVSSSLSISKNLQSAFGLGSMRVTSRATMSRLAVTRPLAESNRIVSVAFLKSSDATSPLLHHSDLELHHNDSIPRSMSTSSTSSFSSSSDCEEMAVCWVRRATTTTCDGCTWLEPGSGTLLPPTVLPSAVIYAQVSRDALHKAPLGSLSTWVECIRPRFLRLLNRSTATLDTVVTPLSVGLEQLQLALPTGTAGMPRSGGWLHWPPQRQQQSPYKALTMEFALAAQCGDHSVNVTLEVLVTPLSLPLLAVGSAVQATDRAATWLGALGGGASGGGGGSAYPVAVLQGRSVHWDSRSRGPPMATMPTPSSSPTHEVRLSETCLHLLVCTTSGCLFHPELPLPAYQPAASVLRGASLSGGVLIVAAVGGAVDILTLIAGCCVLIGVLVLLLWLCAPSFAAGKLKAAVVGVKGMMGGRRDVDIHARQLCCAASLWRKAIKPRFMWVPLYESTCTRKSEPLRDSSLALRGA